MAKRIYKVETDKCATPGIVRATSSELNIGKLVKALKQTGAKLTQIDSVEARRISKQQRNQRERS